MIELQIKNQDAGGRLDKYLKKYLPEAPQSLLYKSLRKKNILLNGKKASGNELLAPGDRIKIFFSEDTLTKFRGQASKNPFGDSASSEKNNSKTSYENKALQQDIPVLLETSDYLFFNKPPGLLTQKAAPKDYSLTEYLRDYLKKDKDFEPSLFSPSPVHRLDRNTSGIVACAKTLSGARYLSEAIRERSVKKLYLCIVKEGNPQSPFGILDIAKETKVKRALKHSSVCNLTEMNSLSLPEPISP